MQWYPTGECEQKYPECILTYYNVEMMMEKSVEPHWKGTAKKVSHCFGAAKNRLFEDMERDEIVFCSLNPSCLR